jgi:hypothetical protein
MNTITKMDTYRQGSGRDCRAEARLAVSHGGDQGVAPERQPLSDRRMARARVLAARSARRRQVLPAAAATHWARPSCMAPCSVSPIRVETPASRRRAACCKAEVTRSAIPKPALARPSVRNTSSGCDGCFLLSRGSGLHTIRRSTSEAFSHGVSFFSAEQRGVPV